jgi:hypothetical protein
MWSKNRTWAERGGYWYSSCGKYRAYFNVGTPSHWMLFYPYRTKNKEQWQYFGPDCLTLEEVNDFLDDLESGFRSSTIGLS